VPCVKAAPQNYRGSQSLAELTQCGSQSSGARSLAGIIKTSMCVFHVTDGETNSRTSTCGLQLTRRDWLCSVCSSCGLERRTELRRNSDDPDTVLGLVLALLASREFGGICRNRGAASMLLVLGGKFHEGRLGAGKG